MATETIKAFLNPTGFLIDKIVDYVADSTSGKSTTAESKSIDELTDDAGKQLLKMQMAESQAKVAQEVAIAYRIQVAETVEIEEFYDLSGEGNAGVNYKESSINLGFYASGKKVSKRIYKFTGVNESLTQMNSESEANSAKHIQ